MTEVLKSLVEADYPYDFWRGATEVRTKEDAKRGINCETLAHMALARMGVWLPPELRANEMFFDMRRGNRHMAPTPNDSRLWRPGDIMFFGLDWSDRAAEQFAPRHSEDGRNDLMNWADSPIRHVGVVSDVVDGGPVVLHTSPMNGIEIVRPDDIMSNEWHEKVWGVGRPVTLPVTEV
jgi:hypothetical protein